MTRCLLYHEFTWYNLSWGSNYRMNSLRVLSGYKPLPPFFFFFFFSPSPTFSFQTFWSPSYLYLIITPLTYPLTATLCASLETDLSHCGHFFLSGSPLQHEMLIFGRLLHLIAVPRVQSRTVSSDWGGGFRKKKDFSLQSSGEIICRNSIPSPG